MARGRKPTFDAEKAAIIIELLEKGNYLEVACAVAGIPERTVYSWIKGERASKNIQITEFVQAIKKARAVAETKWLNVVEKAAKGYEVRRTKTKTYENQNGDDVTETEVIEEKRFDWQAAMTVMERAYPERWGRKPQKENQNEDEVTSEDLPKDFLK